MSLDFWAVKIRKDITEEDFMKGDYWGLIEDDEIYDLEHKDIYEFFLDQDCRVWYNFCLDTVEYFVSGDPIHFNSKDDINVLCNKLNDFIRLNPDYEYSYDEYTTCSNEKIKKFIKYINLVRDKGFVLWCSW